jgi:glycosyltransferase involved in cell wall biosynthesis
MSLVACINCYDDMPMISDCVSSIYNKVDRIIAVDGRYRDFPHNEDYSTDGTVEYLAGLDKVELVFSANLFEADKRNVYMDMLKHGDTVLVIDGDEVVVGDIKKLPSKIDIGLINLGDPRWHYHRLATRFFKYRKGLRHKGIHFIMEYQGKWFNNRCHALNGFKECNINTFKIDHYHNLRSRHRKSKKVKYRVSCRARESKYKIAPYE